ncbi:MAG: sigma-70 family RNA polymerase sigma factor [Desulfotomaculaceae bacterium]|nr:sigma-70 family RNA polymerase sigma factor [Desulfotomaculaceae bacterium]
MKIKYEFLTGERFEVEAPDVIGEVCVSIDRETANSNRRETRRHRYFSELAEQGKQLPDQGQDIPAILERKEMSRALPAALDKLLPQQRELILAVFYEGRSISEIAREQGVNEKAIRKRLKKIYQKLKIFLD